MHEVACRMVHTLLDLARGAGVSLDTALAGLSAPQVQGIRAWKRVDWDVFLHILGNLHAALGGDEGLRALGRSYGADRGMRSVRAAFGMAPNLVRTLEVVVVWGGQRNFTCVKVHHESRSDGWMTATCVLDGSVTPSRLFLFSIVGAVEGILFMLGIEHPTVEWSIEANNRVGRYRVLLPRPEGPWAKATRWLRGIGGSGGLVRALHRQRGELRDAIEGLTRQKREFEQLVAAISDGVLILAGDRVLFGNARLVEMTGAGDLAALVAAPWSGRVPGGQVERWRQQAGAADTTPAADLEIVRPDGARVLCEVRHQGSIRWSEQEGALLVVRDVTERRALERALAQVARREREQVAHDLHDGVGQMLAAAALQAATVAASLERAGATQARTATEVAALLRECGGQIRAMAHALSPVTLEARGLVPAVRELAATGARLIGLECTVEAPTEIPFVPAEVAAEAYRIVQESLSNAARHGRARTARVHLRAADGGLWIHIDDDGCGFPEGDTRASGLGLRIMRHRAASFGGQVRFERAPSGGARVTCWVPALPVHETKLAEERAPAGSSDAPIGQRRSTEALRVVLVDDHPVFRRGLAEALRQFGLEVIGQSGEIEAVDPLIGALRPDVVVTDLLFGERIALDAVRRWRRSWPGLGIVVLTMFPEGAYRAQALEAGADAYVGKHAAPDLIARTVRESSARGEKDRP